MTVVQRVSDMRALSRKWRSDGVRVALVPTMGALHDGHLSLVRLAREHAGRLIVSIFVNPAQFGPGGDFAKYPRTFNKDARLLEEAGADALFFPGASEIYPEGSRTFVSVEGPPAEGLCAASRPGHFKGVATVVCKLFNICEPDIAVFGQKDAQQLALVRRMARDLLLPVEILSAPILREADGLAMSSRNAYLSLEERAEAPSLYRALSAAEALFASGERGGGKLAGAARKVLASSPLCRADYVELVDAETLLAVERVERPALLALAVFLGPARLIDNAVLDPGEKE